MSPTSYQAEVVFIQMLSRALIDFSLQNPVLEPDWVDRFAVGIARKRAVGLESVPIKWEESYER